MRVSKPEHEAATIRTLRRLGKNINGYLGETVDIKVVLRDCVAAARANGWAIEEVPVPEKPPLLALSRSSAHAQSRPERTIPEEPSSEKTLPRRVYISTGIHGDEPAGPLAMRRLLQEDLWPKNIEVRLCPCLNPAGFIQNRRENPEGCDLNRDFLSLCAAETRVHTDWLQRQAAFDLSLCLHEDWEADGFYVYELNPDHRPSLAEAIVARVAQVCPIDTSDLIEGRPAHNGIIRPSIDPRARPDWPEAFYLLTHKTRLSYTLEAPSDYALECRVAALATGTQAALDGLVGKA